MLLGSIISFQGYDLGGFLPTLYFLHARQELWRAIGVEFKFWSCVCRDDILQVYHSHVPVSPGAVYIGVIL